MSIVLKSLFNKTKLGLITFRKNNFSSNKIIFKNSYLKKSTFYPNQSRQFTIANLRGNLQEQENILLNKQTEKITQTLNYLVSDLKDKRLNNKTIQIEKILELTESVDKASEDIRKEAEILFIDTLRDAQLYNKYFEFPNNSNGHSNFALFFLLAPRIRILEENDLKLLNDIYLKMDTKLKEFSIDDSIKLYEALYYYRINFGDDAVKRNMEEMSEKITKNFLDFFTSFVHNDMVNFLRMLVFVEDKEIQKFVNRTKDRMLYTFNEEHGKKLGISLTKKFDLCQFYPRILFSIKNSDPELFQIEKEKLQNFLIESSTSPNMKELNEELVLCIISNYLVWTEKSEKVFESYMNFFYNNLSSFRNELLIELFFLLLNSDFKEFKNVKLPVSMLNLIYQLIKNLKPDPFAIFEDTKEIIYFKKIRKSLIESFDIWDAKNPAETQDSPDYYHKKIIREFIKKSVDMYPFASIDYSQESFDRIYQNLKDYIKF